MRKPPNVYPLRFPELKCFSPVTPDWAQDNPMAPDYIKNKEIAEELRPVFVNGEEFLGKARDTGPLNLVAGDNTTLKTDGNSVIISVTGTSDIEAGTGLKITEEENGKQTIEIDEEVIFVFDCGSASDVI